MLSKVIFDILYVFVLVNAAWQKYSYYYWCSIRSTKSTWRKAFVKYWKHADAAAAAAAALFSSLSLSHSQAALSLTLSVSVALLLLCCVFVALLASPSTALLSLLAEFRSFQHPFYLLILMLLFTFTLCMFQRASVYLCVCVCLCMCVTVLSKSVKSLDNHMLLFSLLFLLLLFFQLQHWS